jgi:hypothetical protein
MGTRAHWMSAPWQYRLLDDEGEPTTLGWTNAATLADVREDVDLVGQRAEVRKRAGRASEGYAYEPHSTIEPIERPAEPPQVWCADHGPRCPYGCIR